MKQKLYSYKLLEDMGIEEQLDIFNKSIDDLEGIGVKLEDEDKAIILLNALPKTFEHLKDVMLYGREHSITLEEVQSVLKAKELQRSNEGKASSFSGGDALNVQKKWDKKKSKKFNKDYKKGDQSKGKEITQEKIRTCHNCKKPGHIKKNYYSWIRKQQALKDGGGNTADIVEKYDASEVLNVVEHPISEEWILDTGCSFHMCPNRSWFSNFKQEELGSVLLGNDQVCPVKGIRNIRIKTHNGSCKVLADVRFIPNLKRNLISLGMLELRGIHFKSNGGILLVRKGSDVVMRGIRKPTLYYLDGSTVLGEASVSKQEDPDLWHLRLGHVSEKGLNELKKQGIL
ncbi:hypothetical protein ACS0TY_020925 [Phlomoides rotata]